MQCFDRHPRRKVSGIVAPGLARCQLIRYRSAHPNAQGRNAHMVMTLMSVRIPMPRIAAATCAGRTIETEFLSRMSHG
jgi:hypothetical protein